MTSPSDIHALSGPYVLDAVDDQERADFESHLAGCPDCGAEVDDLREAVTKLSVYVAQQPPATLKPRVLRAVGRTRQLAPASRAAVSGTGRSKSAKMRVVQRSLTLAAAFLAIAASGGVALDQYRDNAAATAISTRAAEVLAQPDTRTVRGAVTGGGQATVVLSGRQDAAVVLIRDLKPLTGHRTYQLWLIDGSRNARSIGLTNGRLLKPTVVTGGVAGQVALGVTIEPRGGSVRPTMPASGGFQPVVPLKAA